MTGSSTISPPISHTNSNTTDSTITSTTTSSGCTGQVTGGTSNATLRTTGPANCNAAPAAGTVIAKATFSEAWSNGKTSSGTVKLKSTGSATTDKVVTKITSGFGFLAGHITKGSTTLELLSANGNCVSTDISMDSGDNATVSTITQT